MRITTLVASFLQSMCKVSYNPVATVYTQVYEETPSQHMPCPPASGPSPPPCALRVSKLPFMVLLLAVNCAFEVVSTHIFCQRKLVTHPERPCDVGGFLWRVITIRHETESKVALLIGYKLLNYGLDALLRAIDVRSLRTCNTVTLCLRT
jgi:hypothetical protein